MLCSIDRVQNHKPYNRPVKNFQGSVLKLNRPLEADKISFSSSVDTSKSGPKQITEEKSLLKKVFELIALIIKKLIDIFSEDPVETIKENPLQAATYDINTLKNPLPGMKLNSNFRLAADMADKLNPDSGIKHISIINRPDSTALTYDRDDYILIVNACKIPSDLTIKEAALDAERLLKLNDDLIPQIASIVERSSELAGIEKHFKPEFQVGYDESPNLGYYNSTTHTFTLNAYWLEKSSRPELMAAQIAAHELTHARSNLDFALVDQDDIPDKLKETSQQNAILWTLKNMDHFQAYRDYRAKHNPVDKRSDEYQRCWYYCVLNLIDYSMPDKEMKVFAENNQMFARILKQISKTCDIDPSEVLFINLGELNKNNKVELFISNPLFKTIYDDSELAEIKKKIEARKDEVRKILKKNNGNARVYQKVMMKYNDIWDEANARSNAARIMQSLIEEGYLKDSSEARELIAMDRTDFRDQVFKYSSDVKQMIESGQIKTKDGVKEFKLDQITLGYLYKYNHYFKLDLTTQARLHGANLQEILQNYDKNYFNKP